MFSQSFYKREPGFVSKWIINQRGIHFFYKTLNVKLTLLSSIKIKKSQQNISTNKMFDKNVKIYDSKIVCSMKTFKYQEETLKYGKYLIHERIYMEDDMVHVKKAERKGSFEATTRFPRYSRKCLNFLTKFRGNRIA